MSYRSIRIRFERQVLFLQLYRPDCGNTINHAMAEECIEALDAYQDRASVVVLEGLPGVFCAGADFSEVIAPNPKKLQKPSDAERLYDLWCRLASGSFISVAHVRGKVLAGGVGFAACCDLVLGDKTVQFVLSELPFGLFPACVLPFLVRRIGFQKAHFMTLTTQPLGAEQALQWGLVDAYDAQSDRLVAGYLKRLTRLDKHAVEKYKRYVRHLKPDLFVQKAQALEANRDMFCDPSNVARITAYQENGLMPWEEAVNDQ